MVALGMFEFLGMLLVVILVLVVSMLAADALFGAGQRRGWPWLPAAAVVGAAGLCEAVSPSDLGAGEALAFLALGAALFRWALHRAGCSGLRAAPIAAFLVATVWLPLGAVLVAFSGLSWTAVAAPRMLAYLVAGLANLVVGRSAYLDRPAIRALYLGLLGLLGAGAFAWQSGGLDWVVTAHTITAGAPFVLVLLLPSLDQWLVDRDRQFGVDLYHGRVAALLALVLLAALG